MRQWLIDAAYPPITVDGDLTPGAFIPVPRGYRIAVSGDEWFEPTRLTLFWRLVARVTGVLA